MPTPIIYSKDELAWIKLHASMPRRKAHAKFRKKFGRADVSLIHFTSLCKRNGWLTGRTGQYPKGNISYNKGKKMPPGQGGNHPNARKTQFKKGGLPANTKHLGHERVTVDGYVEISIAETNPHTGFERRYVQKHKYLWEQKNGKVPAGMRLKCVDGNRQNTDPENWALISRGALPFLNGHRGYNYDEMPAELKPAVLNLARIKSSKSEIMKRAKKGTKL